MRHKVFKTICWSGWLALSVMLTGRASEPVANFMMLDQWGNAHELRRQAGRAVVLFFTANGCPVVRQNLPKLKAIDDKYNARGVALWLVNSSAADDRSSIIRESYEMGAPLLPVLKDDTQGVARHLKAYRTGEIVVIRTEDWTVAYRGAIDDQFVEGAGKPEATENYLVDVLEALIDGKELPWTKTVARGCLIPFEATAGRNDEPVSYVREVAPILATHCVGCHSAGNIGSWSMSSHRRVRGMASMMEEVVLAKRMPPWDADPEVGHFINDSSLSLEEARTLLLWVEQGAKQDYGEANDPLTEIEVPVVAEWPMGKPDIILKLPKPERIPATGVLDYRHVEVHANNEEAAWVRAVWVKPGNRRVVHHVIARLKEWGLKDHLGMPEMYVGWAPGTTQGPFPDGTGKYLPAKARFDLELHYTTCGSEQTDETEVGIYLMPEIPPARYESVPVVKSDFVIQPLSSETWVSASYAFPRGATLHSVTPHMHLRGKAMAFELWFPDGRRRTICSVPRYDFNWQQTYALKKPVRIPAGTWAVLKGSFDNSPQNPANPNPNKRVGWGEQSWDEMFLGWYNVAWDPEEPTASQPTTGAVGAQP
jgi:hypothetical protein